MFNKKVNQRLFIYALLILAFIPLVYSIIVSEFTKDFLSNMRDAVVGETTDSAPTTDPNEARATYSSAFASLRAKSYRVPLAEVSPSGPFQLIDKDKILIVGRCGDVMIFELDGESASRHTHLGKIGQAAEMAECGRSSGPGVKDMLLLNDSILISYIEFDEAENGYRLVLYKYPWVGERIQLEEGAKIFESEPAVPRSAFVPIQSYGRLAKRNEDEAYLTLGDFGVPNLIEEDDSSLGKLFLINHSDKSAQLIARGFKSPGGLFYDAGSDQLWMTDHGPHGGDELNLVRPGKHYGWPKVSYGNLYPWEPPWAAQPEYYGIEWGHHDGFEKPKYVFLPSIGISQVHRYPTTGSIEKWRGDLILGSLRNGTLYRLKREGDEIVYAEPIASIGERIRDIDIDDQGKIWLKTDTNKLMALCMHC